MQHQYNNTSTNSSATKKHTEHVCFNGEAAIHDFAKVSREDWPSIWYGRDELHQLLDQDTVRVHQHTHNDPGFSDRGLEKERGLVHLIDEYHNAPIKSYMKDVLGVYQYGKLEYGVDADPDRLRSFAVSRSLQDRERAQMLGKKDEEEAQSSYL